MILARWFSLALTIISGHQHNQFERAYFRPTLTTVVNAIAYTVINVIVYIDNFRRAQFALLRMHK